MVKTPTSILPSTSGEESLSVDTKGEATPSKSVFTLGRFVRSIRQGRVPIILLLVSFVTCLTIFVAAISWDLTYSAGTTAAETLSASLQQQFLKTIITNVINVFEGTEETTENLVSSWADGTFQLSDREAVQKVLRSTVAAYSNFFSDLCYTTIPDGYIWGAFWESAGTDGQRNYLDWKQSAAYDGNLTTWLGSTMQNSYSSPDNAEGYWVTSVIGPNTPTSIWSTVNVWEGTGWKTHCRRMYDSNNVVIGVQNADLTLEFLQLLLADSAAASPYKTYLYALEVGSQGDVMIASSEPSVDFYGYDDYGNANRTLTLTEMANKDQIIAILYNQIAGFSSLGNFLAVNGKDTRLVQLPSGDHYTLQWGEVIRDDNTHWVIAILLNRDAIMAPLAASNRKTIGVVVGVVVAASGLSVLFSFFLAKALARLSRDLMLLADFKFQDVLQADLDKKTGTKKPRYSRISELWRIQRAFHKMVVTFAQALSKNKQFSDGFAGGRRPTLPRNNVDNLKDTSQQKPDGTRPSAVVESKMLAVEEPV
ncbi:hypothetical protein HDU87_004609 [Geranomyces variabilis]|uniref:Uncharacterized protein n=1 Tax=Geranomyces variabilis TaxID=109894 RepID=A0AAD5TNF5_9FUNG|nr:hypothetical protein HDU87_004609 [Geranomyces variabilis]